MSFENLNQIGATLNVIEDSSAEGLRKQIQAITLPVQIISIYAKGDRHFAWILTQAKLVKPTLKSLKNKEE